MARVVKSRYILRLGPSGLKREDVHVLDLFKCIQDLLGAFDRQGVDRQHVALVDVEAGSTTPVFAVKPSDAPAWDEYCRNLADRNFEAMSVAQWRATAALDKHAKQLVGPWEVGPEQPNGVPSARFELEDVVPPPPEPVSLRGSTTIYGVCLWAGGVDPAIWIKVDDGSQLRVSATKAVAQVAAKRLYELIGLEGVAEWDPVTHEITSFRASEVTSYTAGDPSEGFEKLADLAGPLLANVSVAEFMRDVRGDDEDDDA